MEKKNGKTMKGLPISERPYEKVLEKGPVSLSDAELLSVILRSGTKNIPVRDMAEEIFPPESGRRRHRRRPSSLTHRRKWRLFIWKICAI